MVTKKAQGISINVIIIAAIALAVLVVLFAIFTGRIGLFSKGVKETETGAYSCVCSEPGKGRVCALANPGGKSLTNPPTQCGSQWTDCALSCFG